MHLGWSLFLWFPCCWLCDPTNLCEYLSCEINHSYPTQKLIVSHGVLVSVLEHNWTPHDNTISLRKEPIGISHISLLLTMYKFFVLVAFLSVSHYCVGDVVSFHRALANYSANKHLGNLTSGDQMHHTRATPSPSESILSYPRKCVLNLGFYPWNMPEHVSLV